MHTGPDAPADQVSLRVERTRRVVSMCSQTIIRAYDEQALLAEECRLLVDAGGYRMAWVGTAEESPEKMVRTVAHAGLSEKFLSSLHLSWANDLRNRDPTSLAIREQRPHVARDIPADPRLRRLRAEAEAQGYQSAAAFPLQFGPHGMGVLTVYSAQADAFGPEEVALLRELAGDMASGISALRDRGAREWLEEELELAEQRYRGIIENAREGIFQATKKGELLLVNRAMAILLGHDSPEALLAQVPARLSAYMAPGHEAALMARLSSPAKDWPFETRMRRKDGSQVWVALNAQMVDTAEGAVIEGFVQDITAVRLQ
ncbi:MAG: GAF domain-containing protein, partial [Thermoplasmatota archaeon]